ncbi:hypothetical protein OC842_001607 [Tilletia horrida]|uniref:THIF-type NAD/FAD binding fold domain-containing protein n=1 Tax=Tilletia horrida TaxID=155126 RepID=A0AAN6JLU9_9BASI|nr:hypothetical protein OC842_001607 [Tilletia horrida]
MDAGSSHPEGTRRAPLLRLLLLSSAADDHDHDHVRVAAAAIAGVGLASSALTACAIFSFQSHQRRRRRRELQDRVKRATQQQHYDDEHEQPPRTPHPPASPTPTHTPTPAAAAAAASHAALHRHHHHHHLSHSQSSSSSTSASTDGGTPRYLSQLQLQAAAAALDAQRPGPAAIIPPPLMPQRLPPQRTPSSSSLRSSLTASSTLHHHQQSSSSSSSSSASSALTSATLHPSTAASPSHKHTAGSRYAQAYPESLIREQLARHYSFFSPATLHSQRTHLLNQQQQQQQQQPLITTAPSALPNDDRLGMPAIRSAFVIVVGVGGVGSHAALALLRSGIAHLRLIDFDQVSLSSLNRHACATLADVGRSKVHVCAEKLAAIAPWAHVEPYNELFRASEAKRLLTSPRRPDFIIDAIDNIDTKVDLLAFAYTHHIRIITASGAGAKSDPSRIQIADLSATSEDPLARAVRRRLKLLGIPKLRDKLGDGHGTAPRARTVKKREKKEQQQQQQQEEESKERPHTPTASLAAKESPAIVAPPKKSGSIPPASPLEKFVTPLSTPFDEESEEHAGVQQDSNYPSPSPSPSGRSGVSPSPSPSPAGTRRFTHSRRASSTSSMGGGNARYQTPLMSPSELRGGGGENGEGLMLAPPPPPPMVLEEGPDQAKDARRTEEALKASLSAVAAEAEPEAEAGEKEDGEEAEDDGEEEQEEEEEEEEGDPTTNKKAKGTPFSRTRKPHSHALTPSALLRSSLELDPLTGHRLTLPCVFSTEKSDVRLLELPEDEVGKGKIEELAALEDFRVRVLPVLGPIPAMFGLAAATYVLCEIAGWPMEPLPYLNRRKMYEKMLSDLEVCERRHPHPHAKQAPAAAAAPKLPFALSDIAYLTEEVFHSRSCIPPFPTLTTSAVLMRWDSTLPLGVNNVVLLSKEEGKVHAREVLKAGRSPWEVWGRAAAEEVKRRMVAERRMQVFR